MRNACLVVIFFAATLFAQDSFLWNLPQKFPRPIVPADNPMTAAKVELGRHLFYDQRMSVNGKQSCAGCHKQELAFTDGRARGEGTTGELHPRRSMSLANVGYNPSLTWDNPHMRLLEEQALIPILGTISVRSPYDRYRFDGDLNALNDSAKRGLILFFSGERMACIHCHGGWNLNGAVAYSGGTIPEPPFQNTGLYNLSGRFSYPEPNTGLQRYTQRAEDIGKFRVPTLRNIAVTAPYMHDGSVTTLEEAIEHYASGGRTISDGPNAGVGRDNPQKASNIQGFVLAASEQKDLVAFLHSLTDSEFLNNPGLGNPWRR